MTDWLDLARQAYDERHHRLLRTGDRVAEKNDPDHTGKILSVGKGTARIIWDHTSWISDAFLHTLIKLN